MWNPGQYEQFRAQRSKPFFDLLQRVDLPGARHVVDLGCGTGALTATLADRWPAAYVVGIDSSAEMLARAEGHGVPGRLEFREADLRDWQPEEPVDLIVSNATLQWVPEHLSLLGRLGAFLAPGGVLAFQVPGNFREPTHTLLRDLRQSPRWRETVGDGADRTVAVHEPGDYLHTLLEAGLQPEVWETTYVQLLAGDDPVLEWVKGTALRPVLSQLGAADAQEFLRDYAGMLRDAYPPGPRGTVLPYRRIFAVARREGASQPAAIAAIDHVQVAIPVGGEDAARGFYGGLLGLAEVPKPPVLAARGGCWFRGHRTEVHVGVDKDFRPAKKAHVALSVPDLEGLAQRLAAGGAPVTWDEELAPRRRFYTDDPFGNRIELLEPQA